MGGRGSVGIGVKKMSPMVVRIMFNSAKKSGADQRTALKVPKDNAIEKAIKTGRIETYVQQIKTEEEAMKARLYVSEKHDALARQIMRTGGAEALMKKPALYNAFSNTTALKNAIQEKIQEKGYGRTEVHNDADIREKMHSRETTTYDTARNRRIKNFEAWFFGSKK